MLLLLSMQPLSAIPDLHMATARRLAGMGFAASHDGCWYPTGRGLAHIGFRMH